MYLGSCIYDTEGRKGIPIKDNKTQKSQKIT